MSTLQLQNLLGYINGLSLSASNRRWLAEHLYMPEEKTIKTTDYYESERFYQDIDTAEADIAAGKGVVVNDINALFA